LEVFADDPRMAVTRYFRMSRYTPRMKRNASARLRRLAALALLPLLPVPSCFGWGSTGHSMINRLAAESLPGDVPAFLKTPDAINEIEYLGPEPDRWRSLAEPELNAVQAPDHFIDFEYADIIGTLPRRRYEYIAALTAAEITHPDKARELQPSRVGFQPYITNEAWERLKSAMRDYRELTAKHADTRPVEAAILFYAGWLGHYVGDGSQPLHVSINYNGWVLKENPNGYTAEHTIHAKFETTFVDANLKPTDVQPLISPVHPVSDEWDAYMAYLRHSQSLVEQLYQLDKQKGFDGAGTPEGKQFTAERLAAGVSMLRDLIDSAWIESAKPVPQWHEPSGEPSAAPAKSGSGL
jgi:S1/P1 Nuclease